MSFRPRLVTLVRCYGSQERVANVPSSQEEKDYSETLLRSYTTAVHCVPTFASSSVVSVVNGNVQFHVAKQTKVCKDGGAW